MKDIPQPKWFSLIPYQDALLLQQQYIESIEGGGDEIIMGLEHPTVITLGKRGGSIQGLFSQIPVIHTQRGGLATAHEPGQLVIYPIINIQKRKIALRTWVQGLEDVVLSFLREHDLLGTRSMHAGVWIGEKKIASIGLQIVNGISSHGLAINIQNSLEIFSLIEVCGLKEQSMTSMKENGIYISTKEAFFHISQKLQDWIENF